MRFDYLLYPAALQKLSGSGIQDRVQKLKQAGKLPYLGSHVFAQDLVDIIQMLKERGYYSHLPPDFAPIYKKTIEGILNRPQDFFWSTEKQGGNN